MAIEDEMKDVQQLVVNQLGVANGLNNSLADGQVTSAKLGASAVTVGKIGTSAVTEGTIATGAVTDGKIGTSAVTEGTIADANVTAVKLATNSVTTTKIADGNIPPSKLSAGGPSWGNGALIINGTGSAGGLEVNASVSGTGSAFVDFHSTSATNPDYDARILADNAGFQIINKYSDTIFSNGPLENKQMRLDVAGNLLVNSAAYGNGLYDGDSFKVFVGSGTTGGLKCSRQGTGATNQIAFLNPNGQVGFINTTGSTTAYGTTSDYRLKEDITSIDNSIERLNQLKPCNFAWKVDGTRMDGFIAHEVQEVVPIAATGTKDAVYEDGTPDYQGIDQAKLVPLLTKALQEAVAKIEALEVRISTLEA